MPSRPLRTEPVRRDEVRFEGAYHRRYRLLTMPLGTFRREMRQGAAFAWSVLVADPDLWQGLRDEAAAAMLAPESAACWRLWGGPGMTLQPFELTEDHTREYVCEHCQRPFLGVELRGNEVVCVCSNRCESARDNARKRQWREANPPDCEPNEARTLRRAEARAGRVCEHCGAAIEAARSTRRFCSGVCRARWHRAGPPTV